MHHSVAKYTLKGEDFTIVKHLGAGFVLYGVADGHAGTEAAVICEKTLWDSFSKITRLPSKTDFANLFKEIHDACAGGESGTTLTVCIVNTKTHAFACANVGDSHCLLVTPTAHIWMSTSHRLQDNAQERETLKPNIGVDGNGRVRLYPGGLSCGRGLGDSDCPHLSSFPAVSYGVMELYDVLVIASDGIWDRLGINKVAEIARQTRCANSILRRKTHYTDDASIIVASRQPPLSRTSLARLLFRNHHYSSSSDDDFAVKIPVPI